VANNTRLFGGFGNLFFEATEMATGKVKVWFDDRGFGFLQRDDGGDDVFVHVTGLAKDRNFLSEGDRVQFSDGTNKRTGRPCAVDVTVL